MNDGLDVVAGTRAALALCDAYLEVLGVCRGHLVAAVAVLDPPVVDLGGDDVPATAEITITASAPIPLITEYGPPPEAISRKSAPVVKGQGGQRKHNLGVVAAAAARAGDLGQSMRAAVSREMGVSEAHAGVLMTQARKQGHEIPRRGEKPSKPTVAARVRPTPGPAAKLRVVEDNTGSEHGPVAFDAQLVADTYLGAVRLGKRPVGVVADRFNVDRLTAAAFVDRARQAGVLPPANEPQLPASERRALLDEIKPEPA